MAHVTCHWGILNHSKRKRLSCFYENYKNPYSESNLHGCYEHDYVRVDVAGAFMLTVSRVI